MAPRPVLILAIVVVGTAGSVSARCCPTCSTRSIRPLDGEQVEQIQANAPFIRRLEADPDLLFNPENQRSLVNLTSKQEEEILRNFPELFTSQPPAELGGLSVPVATCPPPEGDTCTEGCVHDGVKSCIPVRNCSLSSDGTACRQRRATGYTQVCPGKKNNSPLILVRKPNGDVVEMAQIGTSGMNQWILEEDCMHVTHRNQMCGLVERSVRALFINLSGILVTGGNASDFDMAEVIVRCCVVVEQ